MECAHWFRNVAAGAMLCISASVSVATSGTIPDTGADYFSLTPCRIYDTRTPVSDPLRGGPDRRRDIQVSGVCGVPAEAVAVAVNVTAVDASRDGSLFVYDADLAGAPVLLMLSAGRVRANNLIVGLSADGKIAAELPEEFTAADTADLVVDISGYFALEPPTAVADEVTVNQGSVGNAIDVLANDINPAGGTKLVTAIDTTGTLGSVAVTGGGTGISYTPASGDCNAPSVPDTFQYTITGGSTAQVAVHVLCTGIRIVKNTNGQDVNSPPGPSISVGGPVGWQYFVTNTGSAVLSSLSVTDSRGVTVSCPKTSLQPGESMMCTGNGRAVACQYSNVGTVRGTRGGFMVTAEDTSYYFGTPCP